MKIPGENSYGGKLCIRVKSPRVKNRHLRVKNTCSGVKSPLQVRTWQQNIKIPHFQPYEYVAGQNRTKYGKIHLGVKIPGENSQGENSYGEKYMYQGQKSQGEK